MTLGVTLGPSGTSSRNAAFPGAVLMVIGAYLLYWALNGWGVFGKAAMPTATTASASEPTPTTGGSNLA